jgi:hypothetical protein
MEVRLLTQKLNFTEDNIINWLRLIIDIYPIDKPLYKKISKILDRAERKRNNV